MQLSKVKHVDHMNARHLRKRACIICNLSSVKYLNLFKPYSEIWVLAA